MRKLFISYRSSDAAKVDKIALDLSLLRNADGTTRYSTWQDKHNLPPASPNWWDAIVDAIADSDIFVFNISKASLQSEVCRAELDYAHKLNLPIIPVVLDGEFFLDPKSGKYNISYWDLVPDWLTERQFLFYVGTDFFKSFEDAVAMFEHKWPRRLTTQRPLNPDSKSVHGSNHTLYDAACDYAERLAFADAEKHFDALVRRNDSDYADVAAQWLELIRLYTELIEIDDRPNARFLFQKKWMVYTSLFPKEFLVSIFDPKVFNSRYGTTLTSFSAQEPIVSAKSSAPAFPRYVWDKQELEKRLNFLRQVYDAGDYRETVALANQMLRQVPDNPIVLDYRQQAEDNLIRSVISDHPIDKGLPPTSLEIMTSPFAWIEIPHKGYSLGKYPITNAQFGKFIEADGYNQKKWWTDAGWEMKLKGWEYDHKKNKWIEANKAWTQPRFWTDPDLNGEEHPVVGISWYESVAFCLWLSDVTSEEIMLPTETQWQYAAQGDDGRDYPWGSRWDGNRCNNNAIGKRIGKTTPVSQYEGKGNSPFGVVDMAGNVWEWCLTDYDNNTDGHNSVANSRVLRGGSWLDVKSDDLRCDYRAKYNPRYWDYIIGFRISRS